MSGSQESIRQRLVEQVERDYGVKPENPFSGTPDAVVFRRNDNRKWFGLVLSVRADRLGLPGERMVDILNVKCDPNLSGSLRQNKGFLPAYHMNKESWLTILLDGSVAMEQIEPLLDMSFFLTAPKLKKRKNPAL